MACTLLTRRYPRDDTDSLIFKIRKCKPRGKKINILPRATHLVHSRVKLEQGLLTLFPGYFTLHCILYLKNNDGWGIVYFKATSKLAYNAKNHTLAIKKFKEKIIRDDGIIKQDYIKRLSSRLTLREL